jgi:hypothetical protein
MSAFVPQTKHINGNEISRRTSVVKLRQSRTVFHSASGLSASSFYLAASIWRNRRTSRVLTAANFGIDCRAFCQDGLIFRNGFVKQVKNIELISRRCCQTVTQNSRRLGSSFHEFVLSVSQVFFA